uniref:NADH-ubiquinone oxidoreductase chain 2 n=1 Tax=Rhynchothorax sp. JZ-2022 TaxID=2992009 RepID=A0A9E7V7C7_9CHEL|nr:NADH dehydrogenase subunit 2 [Rhynchothorax sp. JZ-2022]
MKITKFYLFLLFSLTIVWGISSISWFSMWMSLEMNSMMFIPLMWLNSYQSQIESTMKYFLMQSISSMLLIGLSISMNLPLYLYGVNMMFYMLFFTLLLKIGMFPFLFWYVEVINKCTFLSMLLIMTVQKLLPIVMMSYILYSMEYKILFILISFNALMGAVLGLNQTMIKKIMALSSVVHMSWLVMSIISGYSIFMSYFFIYSLIIFCLINYIKWFSISTFMSLLLMKDLLFSMNILSLAGLPPFSGFIMKWVVIEKLMSMDMFMISVILILSSLISLYFYLRLMMTVPMISFMKMKVLIINKYYFNFLMLINLMILPLLIYL